MTSLICISKLMVITPFPLSSHSFSSFPSPLTFPLFSRLSFHSPTPFPSHRYWIQLFINQPLISYLLLCCCRLPLLHFLHPHHIHFTFILPLLLAHHRHHPHHPSHHPPPHLFHGQCLS